MLPIIDIAPLAGLDPMARLTTAGQIRAAAMDKGFFYVTDHGVPESLSRAVFEQAKALFALPATTKSALSRSRSRANRGYEALGGPALEPGASALKEAFSIGPELSPDDPRVLAGRFSQGPNQWPPRAPEFRRTMLAYHQAMFAVAGRLMRGLALSLDMPEAAFDGFCRQPIALLQLEHYPAQQVAVENAAAHTDVGALTLLLQDETGGLEVFDRDAGAWIAAPPIPGAFVVNLGDLIGRWTNDVYRPALHRTVNRSGRERYSAPFFFSGAPDHPVACLETCLEPGAEPLYPPTTVEAHLMAMHARTYGEARAS